jgi:serine/threonine protein kinase
LPSCQAFTPIFALFPQLWARLPIFLCILLQRLLSISLCVILVAVGAKVDASGVAADHFVYSGFAGANVTLDGAAVVTPSGLLELTNGTLRQKAHATHPSPLRFRNGTAAAARSFSASFVFGILCPDRDACGHGIVLFVAPESYNLSAAFPSQYIGLVNDTTNGDAGDHLFGVELDTDQNNEFRDIDGNHVGVDVDSLVSVSSATAGYYDDRGAFRNLSLASGEAMRVWVDYDGEEKRINVTMAPLGIAKPSKPLISTAYDLSTVLTDVARVGFSSATGSFNSRHYVLGWSFAMDGPAPSIDISKLPKLPSFGHKHRARLAEIVPPVATAGFILAAGAIAVLLVRRRLRYTELHEDWEVEFGPHRFPYKDLFNATEGFKNKNLLGVGGFGRVYKGVLPVSKMEIAVKKVSHDSKQGMKEFVAEVVSIGRLQHRNLVQLLGYCRRKGELLLVYEYMSNGSLDKHLYGGSDKPNLGWDQRFRIIKGIAAGLLYLHEEWEKVIIHRDIKASNVLLDNDMDGRLGDFGLARLYDHGANPHTTHVVGTIGYLAPELGRTSKATPLTDVFAFGMFVLEVICGQRPIINQSSNGDQLLLIDWVVDHWHKGSLNDTVDARLRGSFNVGEASLALKVGLLCSHPLSGARPSMRQVMKYLNGDLPLPELNPTLQSFESLALMQNEGFDSYIMSYPSSSVATMTTTSNFSGKVTT